ncbi:MAG: hypothetical protein ACKVOP_13795 [Sphingomonadaceae bacterium]
MRLATLLAAAPAIASASVPAPVPRSAVVVTARATIVSGARLTKEGQVSSPKTAGDPVPKPRARACPERATAPCRMIVTDLP